MWIRLLNVEIYGYFGSWRYVVVYWKFGGWGWNLWEMKND